MSSETKSSAGDKHETGRAMLQLEMEKAGQQLASVQQMQQTLAKINTLTSSTNIALGSVIKTSSACYFLSISEEKGKTQIWDAIGVAKGVEIMKAEGKEPAVK